jgi:hypothetical protein
MDATRAYPRTNDLDRRAACSAVEPGRGRASGTKQRGPHGFGTLLLGR